ncbi:unnamed protein product [Dovyalis caffra]|uniref:Uncharacterized protein n=1 Tax=Dovyalis caffra TaxID=77055 RepID=A0AAV1S1N6_9ROSI|nr:unnamed protein product [Dovyalis caffra]
MAESEENKEEKGGRNPTRGRSMMVKEEEKDTKSEESEREKTNKMAMQGRTHGTEHDPAMPVAYGENGRGCFPVTFNATGERPFKMRGCLFRSFMGWDRLKTTKVPLTSSVKKKQAVMMMCKVNMIGWMPDTVSAWVLGFLAVDVREYDSTRSCGNAERILNP